jgi:hypothetical protein
VLCCGPLQRAAAARWGRVQRDAQAVVTGEHEGRATGGGGAKMPFILPIRPYGPLRMHLEHLSSPGDNWHQRTSTTVTLLYIFTRDINKKA